MKVYSRNNFFKHTYCEFVEMHQDFFKENKIHFKSKSDSFYSYTKEGVYRYSNHWGRVANCRWKLLANDDFKNQAFHVGFAKWTDFYPNNETEKLFYISVDFNEQKVIFQHKKEQNDVFLFTSKEAKKRVGQIQVLFKETKWAKYFKEDIDVLREKIISELINSSKNLQQIKLEFH